MPDVDKYNPQTPYIRPVIENPGLSLIVQPKYDYVHTFPESTVKDTNGNAQTGRIKGFWEDTAQYRNQLVGQVPVSPGGVTSYDEAKRYDNKQLGFLPGRDNEDIYAQNQGFFSSVGHGLGRIVPLAITKLGSGVGYLAGLLGIGNDANGAGFDQWTAGAADNGISKYVEGLEGNIKNDWLPIYKKANEKDHGFFRHMGDLDFWTDDLSDGAATIASAFVPGMAVEKLDLGLKALRGIQGIRALGYADEASALAETGIKGGVEAAETAGKETQQAVQQGAEQQQIFSSYPNPENLPDKSAEVAQAIKRIDNAKLQRNINVGATSMINNAAWSMQSASAAKKNAYDSLINQKDSLGKPKYTQEQAKQMSAKVAADTFKMSLGAFSLLSLYEANLLFKKVPVKGSQLSGKIETNGLLDDATLAKKTFGQRAYESLKEPLKGGAVIGLWVNNIQTAIDRLNSNSDNFNLDFGERLKLLGKQYLKQVSDIVTGNDIEAAKSVGTGVFIGGVTGKVFDRLQGSESSKLNRGLSSLNNQVSAFKELGNVYQTEADGSLKFVDGKPVLDEDKLRSWIASFNNVLNLQQLADNLKDKGDGVLSNIYRNEVVSRFAKAHFDNGLGDLLYQKLNDIQNIKPEDLALLGYDPTSKNTGTGQIIEELRSKFRRLEKIHDNIQQNYVPDGIKMNTQEGQRKFFDITDKMFYLTARSEALAEEIKAAKNRYDTFRLNADNYNESFNKASDDAVTKYNELYENLQAAKRREETVGRQQDYYEQLNRRIDEQRNGISVQAPSRLERIQRENPSVNITLPKSPLDNYKELIETHQKALDEHFNNNKELLEKMKKDASGRYLYEVTDKNLLPSAQGMQRQQVIGSETMLAHSATLNVLSRLSDPKFGVKYYDNVYSKEMERQAHEQGLYDDDLTKDEDESPFDAPKKDTRVFKTGLDETDIDEAYNQATDNGTVSNKKDISEHLAEKIANGEDLSEKEEAIRQIINKDVENKLKDRVAKSKYGDIYDTLQQIERERDALEGKDDRTPEEEQRLDELNKKIDATYQQLGDKEQQSSNENTIQYSDNIPDEKKVDYTKILNDISATRKRVQKFPDYYLVDGTPYRKVTDLIGDTISDEQRQDPRTQASVNAGYAIDTLVKAYFGTGTPLNPGLDSLKDLMKDKMTEEAFNDTIKSLDAITSRLEGKGIEIVASNVYAIDDDLKVASEIDLLGVDKQGNFKLYEVQARRDDIYRQYGKRGVGVKIRDIDGKRLSIYRNLFANQYGVIPDEIAVKFPFAVKYDTENGSGFINNAELKEPIRFQPIKDVPIQISNGEPIKIGSKFNSIDMNSIFLNTFVTTDEERGKMRFLFRNAPIGDIKKTMKLNVKPAPAEFQERYQNQREILEGKGTTTQGSLKAGEVIDYTTKEANNFKPEEQLKFNQGTYEPVRIVGSKELIDLIRYGSERTKQTKGKLEYGTGKISDEYGERLEKQFGMSGRDAYNNARDLAAQNRGQVEKIIKLTHFTKQVGESPYKLQKFYNYKDLDSEGKPKPFPNLYTLAGNTDIHLSYEGQNIGRFSPAQTLAYKDTDGKFKILDETTDPQTYAEVTGNSLSTYNDFRRVAKAYKTLHTELTERMKDSPGKSLQLSSGDFDKLFDTKISLGEFDFVNRGEARPLLKDISFSGVKVGSKEVPTVINVDQNDAIKVFMQGSRGSKTMFSKHTEIDRWANAHLEDIKKAITDKNGKRVTDNVAIIEPEKGQFKLVSLKNAKEESFNPDTAKEYVENLGSKFTAAVAKNVFKNQSLQIIPKQVEEHASITLKQDKVFSGVYPEDDIATFEKYNPSPEEHEFKSSNDEADQFVQNADDELKTKLKKLDVDTTEKLLNAYQESVFGSMEDFLNHIKTCK